MNRIRQIRQENGMTQKDLADFLCTSQANISGWENEKWEAPYNILLQISHEFDVSINYILGDDYKWSKEIKAEDFPNVTMEIFNTIMNLSVDDQYFLLGNIVGMLETKRIIGKRSLGKTYEFLKKIKNDKKNEQESDKDETKNDKN